MMRSDVSKSHLERMFPPPINLAAGPAVGKGGASCTAMTMLDGIADAWPILMRLAYRPIEKGTIVLFILLISTEIASYLAPVGITLMWSFNRALARIASSRKVLSPRV